MKRWTRAVPRILGACLLIAVAVGVTAADVFPTSHDIRPGYGVTDVRWLSDWLPALKDTPGDTPVYVLQGEAGGGRALILGGTHANEPAGIMAAILLVERAEMVQGTLYVIPHANNSAIRFNTGVYNRTSPQRFELTTSSGEVRSFRYGDRRTQPEDQEPDPDVFVHYPSGMELDGDEARNLNRNHPGLADGTLTQQISYALFELVNNESVDVVVDMHEASLTSSLANTLVSHPRAVSYTHLRAHET